MTFEQYVVFGLLSLVQTIMVALGFFVLKDIRSRVARLEDHLIWTGEERRNNYA